MMLTLVVAETTPRALTVEWRRDAWVLGPPRGTRPFTY